MWKPSRAHWATLWGTRWDYSLSGVQWSELVLSDKVEIVVDRFGEAAQLSKLDDETARAYVKICKSEQFFGWVAGMGEAVTIAGPKSLVEEYKNYLRELLEE